MKLIWTDDLSTGVALIDRQHQELFDRLNHVLESYARHKGQDAFQQFFTFLAGYVVEHLEAEEREMTAHRYPWASEHKREHDLFRTRVEKLKAGFEEEGPSTVLILTSVRTSLDWLQKHIRSSDKAFGRFLKTGSA